MGKNQESKWKSYTERYKKGGSRAKIFRDLIIQDMMELNKNSDSVVLDIGCGRGIDGDYEVQKSLSNYAKEYIGLEPDSDIQLGDFFNKEYRTILENAPIEKNYVDVAFAFMVLEHIKEPKIFLNKIYNILKPGGVFWGYTVDARHWFALGSMLTERLNIKETYMKLLHGERSKDRYENYEVHYNLNKPSQIYELTKKFSVTEILNFYQPGLIDYYFPRKLKWIGRLLDRMFHFFGIPSSTIAVRIKK